MIQESPLQRFLRQRLPRRARVVVAWIIPRRSPGWFSRWNHLFLRGWLLILSCLETKCEYFRAITWSWSQGEINTVDSFHLQSTLECYKQLSKHRKSILSLLVVLSSQCGSEQVWLTCLITGEGVPALSSHFCEWFKVSHIFELPLVLMWKSGDSEPRWFFEQWRSTVSRFTISSFDVKTPRHNFTVWFQLNHMAGHFYLTEQSS